MHKIYVEAQETTSRDSIIEGCQMDVPVAGDENDIQLLHKELPNTHKPLTMPSRSLTDHPNPILEVDKLNRDFQPRSS